MFCLLGVIAVLTTGGFLFAWSGLVSVAASSGHWNITYRFLDFTKRNSVELQSQGIETPPLDNPAWILKGAGHYATGCAPCHGAPGTKRTVIALQMTPQPPRLERKISRWKPQELFWIVKHGIKYTGMPSWPALERDDEIWAMVAFLQKLPAMKPETYERLAYGERAGVARAKTPVENSQTLGSILENCARCHGMDGAGRGMGAFPRLAGQSKSYLLASLRAFAEARRSSGIMQPAVAALSDESLQALAGYYSSLPPFGASVSVEDVAAIARGREIAEHGIPARGVPSCEDCHGPGNRPRNPVYPELSGQYADYLFLQLRLFKAGERGGTSYAHIMNTVTNRMTEEQMRKVALYYASVKPQNPAAE